MNARSGGSSRPPSSSLPLSYSSSTTSNGAAVRLPRRLPTGQSGRPRRHRSEVAAGRGDGVKGVRDSDTGARAGRAYTETGGANSAVRPVPGTSRGRGFESHRPLFKRNERSRRSGHHGATRTCDRERPTSSRRWTWHIPHPRIEETRPAVCRGGWTEVARAEGACGGSWSGRGGIRSPRGQGAGANRKPSGSLGWVGGR